MGIASFITNLYRFLIPLSIRKLPIIEKLKGQLFGHDYMYSSDYYKKVVEDPAARSAGTIAKTILNDFKATSVIDVGCGTGALLEALRDRGCDVFGLEYSEAALKYCHARQLIVAKFNLERDVFNENRSFDIAVSMEVAEHLPKKAADRYVALLAQLSNTIVFTAAPIGQGGTDHVNEQPPSYWIAKFQIHGFSHAEEISQRWRESWKNTGDVDGFYYRNLMIFHRIQTNK